MTTAQALEAMTDRGKFERLATSVLRELNKKFAAIISTGTNAKGEPIKSPLDGFCQVPESEPSHFLLVEHTTTAPKSLEDKWLFDHTASKSKRPPSDDGDLVKSGRETQKLRQDFPKAKFTVILTTNRTPSTDIMNKVYKKAGELNVSVELLDQSRIVDFLDNEPKGHWLRKEYLRIEAELLSLPLLHQLCEQSLTHYEKEFLITDSNSWVEREIDGKVGERINENRYTIQFLSGESGYGKSAIAFKALKNHLGSGEYGIWLPVSAIEECNLLRSALDKVLRDFYPSLQPNSGQAALELIPNDSRLLIIFDDVNRSDSPGEIVEQLIRWAKPLQSSEPSSENSSPPYLVVVPLWSHVWEGLDSNFGQKNWIDTVFVDRMNQTEGAEVVRCGCLKACIEITDAEANSLAKNLDNDPILIGMFVSRLNDANLSDLNALTENVVEDYINDKIKKCARARDTSYFTNEYRKALSKLSRQMLINRHLIPLWEDITNWFKDNQETLKILREIAQDGGLCRETHGRFAFGHDRIRDNLLVESISKMLEDTSKDLDIFWEPFYAKLIGLALVKCPQTPEFLKEMRNRLPLALVEAIRSFGNPTTNYHKTIIGEVKEWANSDVATGSVPDSVLSSVCWSLLETDSPAVLEITEKFPKYPVALLARLRNGCAKSGVLYCSSRNGSNLTTNDSLRDQIISHATSKHKNLIVNDLRTLLTDNTLPDHQRKGALTFAGFLGIVELKDAIAKCWELTNSKTEILAEAIWAATQCYGAEPAEVLDPMLKHWAGVSDQEDDYGMSPIMVIAMELNIALQRGIDVVVANHLIQQCNVYKPLEWPITYMLERVDNPYTIQFIVKQSAKKKANLAGISLTQHWDERYSHSRRLSEKSMDRLHRTWKNQKKDKYERQYAFRLWLVGAGWEKIDVLRNIPSDSLLFRPAVWKRVELGDDDAVPDLLKKLETNINWFHIVHHVWCEEIMQLADHHLESFKENIPTDFSGEWLDWHYELSELMKRIPIKDAEKLLVKHWNHLGYSPQFIQTALYVGSEACKKLAEKSIKKCPNDIAIFKHIGLRYGFTNIERQKYLTQERLDNFLPYLNRFGERELADLADVSHRIGIPEWGKKHLTSLLSPEARKRYFPTDKDLLQDLEKLATEKQGKLGIRFWLEKFEKRHDPKERILKIVRKWLKLNPTVKGLEFAAECIQSIGTREDLSIIDDVKIEESPDKISMIKENARYGVYRRTLE